MEHEGGRVRTSRDGHVLTIALDRPEKRNAADLAMLGGLAAAYGELDRDDDLRVGLVVAEGPAFTAGLDLDDVAPRLADGTFDAVPADGVDPWGLVTPPARKPVVVAVQGWCLTLGVELILAADIAVAADDTVFAQAEVSRAILPFGGATLRLPRAVGWGDAMRILLTGDRFDAAEALRIGLVQQVVPRGEERAAARAIADRIAAQAPLAVQAALANARLALDDEAVARDALRPALARLLGSDDAAEGLRAFRERDQPRFTGR